MAKKQKKAASERAPTKHQLSKWQRQMKIRRIVIIAAVVFLAGISSWVGYGYYTDYKARVGPLHEVMIEVNGVNFTMEYYVKMLNAVVDTAVAGGLNSTFISSYAHYIASAVADNIINAELVRQEATGLGITVTTAEVDARLKESGYDEAYRDWIRAVLLHEKLNEEYFGPQLPVTMNQSHVQVMLVESQEVATELIAEIEAGGNFTALAEKFSCNSSVEGDLGWLPEELMPNTLIANPAFNLTIGELSQPIYDKTAIKDVGYWLIEVTDKQDEKIKARAMLLGSEAEAEWVKAKLVSGNFSSLAMNYSQHKSKTGGGELGWLKVGNMSSTAFDKVAFNLTLNEVSEPVKDTSVQTTGGYWLVKVIDRGDHELEEKVKGELIDNYYNAWLAEWTKESTIATHLEADKISWAVNKVLEGR
jgi:parvulin-like peptidyl-prolyl isomerase